MALRNIHPADELAVIRSDMRRLKEREEFLSRGFVNNSLPRFGQDVIADVFPFEQRTFLREKLPSHILNDESYWRTDFVHHVRVAPAPGSASGVSR